MNFCFARLVGAKPKWLVFKHSLGVMCITKQDAKTRIARNKQVGAKVFPMRLMNGTHAHQKKEVATNDIPHNPRHHLPCGDISQMQRP